MAHSNGNESSVSSRAPGSIHYLPIPLSKPFQVSVELPWSWPWWKRGWSAMASIIAEAGGEQVPPKTKREGWGGGARVNPTGKKCHRHKNVP